MLHAWLGMYYSDSLIVRCVYNYRRLSILPPLHLPISLCLERELLLHIATRTGPGLEPAAVGVVDIQTLVYSVSFVPAGTRPLLTVGSCKQPVPGTKGLLSESGVTSPQLHVDSIGGVRASIKTEVGALVLDQATGEVVESLVAG